MGTFVPGRAQPHGKDEVLVVGEVDGEARNILLRNVPKLNAKFKAADAERDRLFEAATKAHEADWKSVEKEAFSAAIAQHEESTKPREDA